MLKFKQARLIGKVAGITCCLSLLIGTARGETLIDFSFNEGTGIFVNDSAQGLLGTFGPVGADPAFDTVALHDDSPSGLAGDRSFVNNRGGFLMTDDSATGSLDITNGPITMEAWIKVNSKFSMANEGIAAYGNSYKLGLRSRKLTFTLFGAADITMGITNAFPVDTWVHVAAAWTPGVGVDFYITSDALTTNTFTAYTARLAARPIWHNYLSVGSEGFAVPLVGSFDRVKIHNRVLAKEEIDNVAATPKANYIETKVAYDFNESEFPSLNTVASAPDLPLTYANSFVATLFAPIWTNDTPSGLDGDFALAFNLEIPTNKHRINLDFTPEQLNLGVNNTNYTLEAWVKLPSEDPIANRMVILRTSGPAPRASLSINTDRKLWTTIYNNTDFKSSVDFPNDLEWHHVAVVVTNFSQVHFYLNGELRQTMNRTATGVPGAAGITNLLIGMEADATYFKGLLDRVRISNSALSAEELDSVAIPLPKLVMQLNGNGGLTLSWPSKFTDYVLESTAILPAVSWTEQAYTTEGDQHTATITPSTTENRFYRLRK
jgi:hypothetical protein